MYFLQIHEFPYLTIFYNSWTWNFGRKKWFRKQKKNGILAHFRVNHNKPIKALAIFRHDFSIEKKL